MIQEEGPTNAGAEAHLGYCEVRYYRLHFFFNDTATTEIYTLSLHDALPICRRWCGKTGSERQPERGSQKAHQRRGPPALSREPTDRKSTRLNSSHVRIS